MPISETLTSADDLAGAPVEMPAGYYLDPNGTGAWMTSPWPWQDPEAQHALMRRSLGPAVIRWAHTNLVHHLYGTPWRYTPGQQRFLVLWYAVDAEGRFTYRRGIRRGAKGTGKDPFAGAWLLGELAGPVRVADMDDGRPVGEPHRLALCQIAANSAAQAGDVLRVANAMVSRDLADEIGYDAGITRSQTDTGSRIELLTSSESSSEGDPATAIALNESHHMTSSNGGLKVAKVAQRNVGKSPRDLQARMIEFTNAHQQGSDSRAERSYTAWQDQVAGRTRTGKLDILYDSIEAPPDVDMTDSADLRRGILAAYADATAWADIDRLVDEANDPDTSIADLIRYYLNGLAAAEDAWVIPGNFDDLGKPDTVVDSREQIAMFLDCSKSGDATGLVGARLSDGHVMTLGVWQQPVGWDAKKRGPYRIPRAEVDATVRAAFAEYRVVWFGVDPSPATDDDTESNYWMPLIDEWHRDFKDDLAVWATPGTKGHSVLFDMRLSKPGAGERMRAFTEQAEQTAQAIDEDASLTHDGHPLLRTHVHNARRRPNQWGLSLGKVTRDSTHLVDLAVCMVGALLGRRLALNSGKTDKQKRTGGYW